MFEPMGTPETMTVRSTQGALYDALVYPSPIAGLGICKHANPRRVAEWCVVHRGSGVLLATARDGQAAIDAANALGFAASSAGAFWVNALETVTSNAEAMERCKSAVTPFSA